MNRYLAVFVLLLITALALSGGAVTLDDFKRAQELAGKAETYSEGLQIFASASGDGQFAKDHPEEAAMSLRMVAGDLRVNQKKAVDAIAILQKGLAIAPRGGEAEKSLNGELAWAYFETAQPVKSAETFQWLITNCPSGDVAGWKWFLGKCYQQAGQYDSAAVAYEAMARDFPKSPSASGALAEAAACLEKQGRYQEEIDTLKRLLRQYPDSSAASSSAESVNALTLLYLDKAAQDAILVDHREKALIDFIKYAVARDLGPSPSALALMGSLGSDDGFAKLHPEESAWARLKLGQDMMYQQKKPTDAAAMLEKALSTVPADGALVKEIKDQLAWACLETGNVARAVDLYKQLIADYPKGNICWWKTMMADGISAEGRYADAISLCAEAVKDAAKPADAVSSLRNMAGYQHRLGLYQDEVATLRQLATSAPGTPDAKIASSRADVVTVLYLPGPEANDLVSVKKQEMIRSLADFARSPGVTDTVGERIDAMKKALDLGPDDPKLVVDIDYWLGDQYRASAQHQQAVDMGQRLLADCKGQANEKEMTLQSKVMIGYAYQRLHQYDKAIPVLEDVVTDLDPGNCGANFNLASCYYGAGRYEDAAKYYDKVAANSKCPGVGAECLVEKATMLVGKLKQVSDGVAVFRQAFLLSPEGVPIEPVAGFLSALSSQVATSSIAEIVMANTGTMSADGRRKMLASVAAALRSTPGNVGQCRPVYAALVDLTDGDAKTEVAFQMANCDYEARDWASGAADCQALFQMQPSGKYAARSLVLEASCWLQAGNKSAAVAAFEKVRDLFPDTPDAQVAKQYLASLATERPGGDR